MWLEDSAGKRYLDAMSGGSMAATLGYGRSDLVAAAREQALEVSYLHNERTHESGSGARSPPSSWLSRPEEFTRVHFVTGGAEANETAVKLARAYHVERGEPERWRVISPAQAYHGPTIGTLALTGRPGLKGPLDPYMPTFLHIPPATARFDPTGEATLEALDRVIEEAGPETISAFFCEPISGAALPGFKPPDRFWEGLAERRERHGFLICFDEIVTGMGRTGSWFAAQDLPFAPDVIATAKGLGAGYAAIGAALCREHVYEAVAAGSRTFPLGHTWNGAPLSCAVGLAVVDALRREGLIEHVRERGAAYATSWRKRWPESQSCMRYGATAICWASSTPTRGTGAPRSCRPSSGSRAASTRSRSRAASIILSTQPTRDGYAGDQSLFAPAFTAPDKDLAEMVERFAAVRPGKCGAR